MSAEVAPTPPPAPASPPPPPAPVESLAEAPPAPGVAVRGRSPAGELGAWVFRTEDGDTGALGAGLFARYRLVHPFAAVALVETTGEEETAVGPAVAAYRRSRLGLGASVMRGWGRVFLAADLIPELTLLSIQGKQLAVGRSVTTWGMDVDLRVRLGLATGPVVPFLFVGGSGALRAQHLSLQGNPATKDLSRWSACVGAGVALRFGGTNR